VGLGIVGDNFFHILPKILDWESVLDAIEDALTRKQYGKRPNLDVFSKYLNNPFFEVYLRLSQTRDTCGHPNPKWVAGDPKSVSNRVPIWETHFLL
jgi:hypothetical protein